MAAFRETSFVARRFEVSPIALTPYLGIRLVPAQIPFKWNWSLLKLFPR
jgi:hypothetical protein